MHNEQSLKFIKMYNYPTLNRLSKILRKSGKRTVSDKIIVETANILKVQGYNEPYKLMVDAIELIKPMVELRSQKKSGQSIQIPSAMTTYRQEGRAIRILKEASSKGNKSTMPMNMAQEIIGIIRGEGSQSISKRDSLHRMAISQRGARRN